MARPGGQPKTRARKAAGTPPKATPTRSSQGLPTPAHDRARKVAEGFTWETFERGNYLALKSGHRSPRLVSRLAEDLAAWLVEAFPDLAAPRYRLAVGSLARAESLVALRVCQLDDLALDDESRDRVEHELRAAERRAAEERRNLGLDPSSHTRLVRERAEATLSGFNVDDAIRAGREVLDAREVEALDEGDGT
jgi:hypothetical protein